MPPLRVRILGSGDAFCSGGRLHACFHLDDGSHRLLIDCGASALAGLRRALLDPGAIGWVAISHLHGDHFGGLPWLLLDGFKARTRPLEIAGPPGTGERVAQAFAALYPGAAAGQPPFALFYAQLRAGEPLALGPALVTPSMPRRPAPTWSGPRIWRSASRRALTTSTWRRRPQRDRARRDRQVRL